MRNNATIILVSSDKELSRLLEKELPKNTNLILFKNGVEVLNKIFDIQPNVVIAEYQLAGTNGVKLCNAVKFDIRTKHIPFILLQSHPIHVETTTGIEIGPDFTLQKPFSVDDISSIIKQNLSQTNQQSIHPPQTTYQLQHLNEQDQSIFLHIQTILNEQLANQYFSIEEFAEQLNMSRMQLYRFTKELFALSPNQLLKQQRLLKAKTMLEKKSNSISKVAEACGFSNAAYFSKCFKKEYGCSPKEY